MDLFDAPGKPRAIFSFERAGGQLASHLSSQFASSQTWELCPPLDGPPFYQTPPSSCHRQLKDVVRQRRQSSQL